jgi:hypothetical protein
MCCPFSVRCGACLSKNCARISKGASRLKRRKPSTILFSRNERVKENRTIPLCKRSAGLVTSEHRGRTLAKNGEPV